MRESIIRHKMLLPNSFVETAIETDGDSMPFIGLRFLAFREWNQSEYPLTGAHHFLSKDQAEELIKDLQEKVKHLS